MTKSDSEFQRHKCFPSTGLIKYTKQNKDFLTQFPSNKAEKEVQQQDTQQVMKALLLLQKKKKEMGENILKEQLKCNMEGFLMYCIEFDIPRGYGTHLSFIRKKSNQT